MDKGGALSIVFGSSLVAILALVIYRLTLRLLVAYPKHF